MKNHKFQMIRVGVPEPGAQVRFSGETEKTYARLLGIFVAMPAAIYEIGSTLSLKVGGADVFDEDHDVRLISCGQAVAPNDKFFRFDERIDAGGSAVEGRFKDAANTDQGYPYEAKIFLWLVNETE